VSLIRVAVAVSLLFILHHLVLVAMTSVVMAMFMLFLRFFISKFLEFLRFSIVLSKCVLWLHHHTIFLLFEWITIFVFEILVEVILVLFVIEIFIVVLLLFFIVVVVVAVRRFVLMMRIVAFSFVMASCWAFSQIICVKGKGAPPLLVSATKRGTSPMAILRVDRLV